MQDSSIHSHASRAPSPIRLLVAALASPGPTLDTKVGLSPVPQISGLPATRSRYNRRVRSGLGLRMVTNPLAIASPFIRESCIQQIDEGYVDGLKLDPGEYPGASNSPQADVSATVGAIPTIGNS